MGSQYSFMDSSTDEFRTEYAVGRWDLVGGGSLGYELEGCILVPGSSSLSAFWLPRNEQLSSIMLFLP